MEKVLCNNCGGREEFLLYERESLRYVLCTQCGLGYINPRPTQIEYERHYRDSYQHDRHAITTYDEAVERLKRKGSYEQKTKHLAYIRGYVQGKSRVLEVGSGWGTLLAVLRDAFSAEVEGVELSSLGVEVARRFYNLTIHNLSIEEFAAKTPASSYDFIVANHVVEHFLDPKSLLLQLRELLAEDGHMYIAVPNLAKPDEPPEAFFRMQHPYYFSPKTLREILVFAGLEPIFIDSTGNDIKCIARKSAAKALLPRKGRAYSWPLFLRVKIFLAKYFFIRLAKKILHR